MLTGPSIIPENPQSAVVLLHGYGSNGNDLIALGYEWTDILPDTAFFAPNAPTPIMYDGYEWFSLNDFQPNRAITPDYLQTLSDRANKVVPEVIVYLNDIIKHHSIPLSNIVISGFSQGGLVAYQTAYGLSDSIAGVIGMSAVPLIQPIPTDKQLNVLLTHGKADDVVPYAAMDLTEHVLHQMNQFVSTYTSPYMGHGLDAGCVQRIGQFIHQCLSDKRVSD